MSGDYRLFIKIHNGFPEHPKTGGLSDRAFRNLIELWCYCSRNLTDGIVTKAQAKKILTTKSSRELIEAGYLAEHADSFEMLEYLDHQMSAQQVTDLRERRSAAGAKGGKSKANHLASATANAKQNASKPVADLDVDKDEEKTTTKLTTFAARDDRFDDFWAAYPRRDDKARARLSWTKATHAADPAVIIAGARRYAADPNREEQYTKHATTWLNAESWTNGPLPARGRPTGAGQPGPRPLTPAEQTVDITRDLVARLQAEEQQQLLAQIGN